MFNEHDVPVRIDVPVRREVVLGREVTVAATDMGDEATPRGNSFGFENTSSLAAGAMYLRNAFSESDLVSRGLNLGFCDNTRDANLSGGVSQDQLVRLLEDSRVPGCAERGYSLEDMAQNIESGSSVVAFVNAGELWNRADEPSLIEANHAVLMEGVVRDAESEEITGFYIRDPASSGRSFVDADKVTRMWLDAGGWQIVSAPVSARL
jgi:hypothetical protein